MATQSLPFGLATLRRLNFPKKLGLLEHLYGRQLSKLGIQWVRCWNNIKWKLDLSDPCHRWIVYGWYEGGSGIKFASAELKSGGVMIDSGANIGQWLLYLGALNNVKTLAFEPVSSQYSWLEECLQQQNWDVELIQSGLGSKQTSLEIQCDGARSTLHLEWFRNKNLPRETIQINRLDQFAKDFNITEIGFWKLDVEGAELQALQGASELLEKQSIKAIYIECHPTNFEEVTLLLNKFGYQFFYLVKNQLIPMMSKTIDKTTDFVVKPVSLPYN